MLSPSAQQIATPTYTYYAAASTEERNKKKKGESEEIRRSQFNTHTRTYTCSRARRLSLLTIYRRFARDLSQPRDGAVELLPFVIATSETIRQRCSATESRSISTCLREASLLAVERARRRQCLDLRASPRASRRRRRENSRPRARSDATRPRPAGNATSTLRARAHSRIHTRNTCLLGSLLFLLDVSRVFADGGLRRRHGSLVLLVELLRRTSHSSSSIHQHLCREENAVSRVFSGKVERTRPTREPFPTTTTTTMTTTR